ncbi:ATP-binding cassette domain-containing protein [Glycomyces artemisiae]|uniref:ABC-2 type transport system ATP-binding protein n=1 Tax=Glycomyces artemisiae TaxID=1076443 RepID=A0A2T0UR54_9ACTN|nr:ATP-binding cassette domain-containing protein [Glycomyces artemisiae]PRY60415.1 ABC-2 type transport system ATP-binding protein [Glycomyces artemisiae]
MTTTTVEASGLGKRFKDTAALDGFDLAAESGTVLGLLGPNGAGKTTTVRILTTLLRFDTGRAAVAGFDVAKDARQVRRRIGLTGQQTAVDDLLTARQNLVLFGKLYRLSKTRARERAGQLLDQFGLGEAADRQAKHFSGGMKRRLDLAASMILAPQVLFLDEPTTGLDPGGRREVWDAVSGLAADGTTVVLTTHYLDEADRLCDRIAVIDHGRNLVDDTPAGLKRRMGADRLEIAATDPADLPALQAIAEQVADGDVAVGAAGVSAAVKDPVAALTAAATAVQERAITVADIGLRRPTLDEAFLDLIGDKENQ